MQLSKAGDGSFENLLQLKCSQFMALVHYENFCNKYQMAVNEVSDVNVTYIDAHNSTKAPNEAPWVGPFFLYNNEQLLKWNGSFFINFPLWMRPIWWLYKNQDKNIVRRAMRLHAKLINYEV